uniref:FTH domain-containing protein n=1 Tax=Caenorhabditis elegans TaxID=6239 RepID=Q95Y66_CAEEL|eukprot:NP_497352.1 F-box A protein [Caenorhabditis elegans]
MSDEHIEPKLLDMPVEIAEQILEKLPFPVAKQDKRIEGGNFVKIAFKDLELLLNRVYRLHFAINAKNKTAHDFVTPLMEVLKAKKCVHATELTFWSFSFNDIISILQFFDDQVLKRIEILCTERIDHIERIFDLPQWKNASNFELRGTVFNHEHIEQLFHFKEFQIALDEFSIQDARKLKDDLMERSTFQKCTISEFPNGNRIEIVRVFWPEYNGNYHHNNFIHSFDSSSFRIICDHYFYGNTLKWEFTIERL